MTRTHAALLFAVAALGAGCGQPTHLQYDFGRAYTTTMQVQADLSRPSAAASGYPLSGVEGSALRQRVIEESTDAESGMAEFIKTFTVQ